MALESFPSAALATNGAGMAWLARLQGFAIQSQGDHDHWCWAAVADSVACFLTPTRTSSMCGVASGVIGKTTGKLCNCCDDANEETCDQDETLEDALGVTGNYDDENDRTLDTGPIIATLAGGLPVCLRILWDTGEGHFVGVNGVGSGSDGLTYLSISDPIYGPSSSSVDALCNDQHVVDDDGVPLHGRWTCTYFTGRPQ